MSQFRTPQERRRVLHGVMYAQVGRTKLTEKSGYKKRQPPRREPTRIQMGYQITTLIALALVPAFLAHAYYRWRSDPLRKLRGPESRSFLYGGFHRSLVLDGGSVI
jgi:hypothetical protein